MKKIFAITAWLFVSAAFCQVLLADQSKEELAVSASQAWLALVDKGEYQESWQQAAQFFKNAVDQTQWENSMIAYRKPLGKVLSRKLMKR